MGGARAARVRVPEETSLQELRTGADILELKPGARAKSREKKDESEKIETDFFKRGEEISSGNAALRRRVLTEGKSKAALKKAEDAIAAQAARERIIDLLGDEADQVDELHPRTKRSKEKDAVIGRAHKTREKPQTTLESEWFNTGHEMNERELPRKSRWEGMRRFFTKLFTREKKKGPSKESKREYLAEVAPAKAVEKSKEIPPVSMREIMKLWNKDYARQGVGWRTPELEHDGRDLVNISIHAIANRLEQRVKHQVEKKALYTGAIKSLVMAAAAEVVRKAEKAHRFNQKTLEKPQKAA